MCLLRPGLGPPWVQMVCNMDGEVWVSSTPRRGSVFRIQVPLWLPSPFQRPVARSPSATRRVLLCDDSRITCHVVSRQLAALGADCVAVGSASDAMRAWREQGPFDTVMLDMYTDQSASGLDAAAYIRRRARTEAAPQPMIVLITAAVHHTLQRSAYQAGVDRVLEKPITPEALANLISTRQT